MPRLSAAACLAACAAAAGLAGATARAQQAFHAGIDLVRLPIVVTAKDGSLVHGLRPEDFEILDQGKPQAIATFSEGQRGEKQPLHLGLVLDGSESMTDDIDAAEDAACRFVNALPGAEDVTFIDFDTAVHLGRFTPPSYPNLFERIRARKATGATALYDALALYVDDTADEPGQHILLLYTDGGDTTSSLTFGKLQTLLRLGRVVVYAVGYLANVEGEDRMAQQLHLRQIARETGGDAFFPASRDDIQAIYAKILDEVSSRYTIGYVPAGAAADGRFRQVEVRVTRPDLKDVKVRTRSGYFAPVVREPRRIE
jgi:Ca-activated chloride channel family protein